MDATLRDLAHLLVRAIPTIVFFILLTFYLKYIFFKPMARILEERRKQTEGVRELAKEARESADRKTSEFEQALQLARLEISKENEARRLQWAEEQMKAIAEARAEAERQVQEAKLQIAHEVEQAKSELDTSIDRLSAQIADSLLRRRAA